MSRITIPAAERTPAASLPLLAAVKNQPGVVNSRGHVGSRELAAIQSAGFNEAEIIEIVLHVALNTLTNYVNNVAETDVDFPLVEPYQR